MMEGEQPALFGELLMVFAGSLACVVLFQRLRLPDILAYLLAGALIGPYGLGWVLDSENIRFLSGFGLVFLLFELGLEFSLPHLLSLSRAVFGLGSLQVALTIGLIGAVLFFWVGQSLTSSLLIAGALALSSTAIVVRELRALKLINRHHAQLTVGVLIFQDLAAVIGLILVQAFAGQNELSLYEQIAWIAGKGILLIALLVSIGKWVLPHVFHEIARARSDEIFVLTVLVITLVSAWITSVFGLSMALGAFLTGVMLGESEFRHRVEVDIRPFRDILMGLFFATVGMRIDVGLLATHGGTVLAGTLFLIALKCAIVVAAAMLIGENFTTATKTGVMLAQAGEFGLALMTMGLSLQVVPAEIGTVTLLIALGSIAVTPWLIRYSFEITQLLAKLSRRHVTPRERELSRIPPHLADHVILAGYGRVGQMIAKFLLTNGIPFIALDTDSQLVKRGRAAGHPVIYGSCERVELLKRCHIERARLAILTFKSLREAQRVISQIRELGYSVPIIVRTQHDGDYADLIKAGADHVVPEIFESSLIMVADTLTRLGFPKAMVDEQIESERKAHVHTRKLSE
ncbi:MAG TPA: cation:proton antiporter [Methylococcaceae bacterium]|nr:cation:proton antiporter [Methylococcaceae bacterium]